MPLLITQGQVVAHGQTLYTAEAGYHGEDNIAFLNGRAIPTLIADTAMRLRNARFRDQGKCKSADDALDDRQAQIDKVTFFRREHFTHDTASDSYTCPAGRTRRRRGSVYDVGRGRTRKDYRAAAGDCGGCALRTIRPEAGACTASGWARWSRCLRTSGTTSGCTGSLCADGPW